MLQVSQPRQPCWKLDRRWNWPKLAVRVQQTGRTGWYLRVLEEGTIQAGDEFRLLQRPHAEVSVQWANRVMYARPRRREDDLRLSQLPALSESWKRTLAQRTNRDAERADRKRLEGK
ncbi:MAG: MOSC domain-containing protein [Pirellulales bacterium]|nr:MOSC domain-containing protein [Pirellulales bacterium]